MNDTHTDPASIFNDVIGPVMTGPSSSHTAGPARIGKAVRLLLGEDPVRARVVFKKNGAYPDTYFRQGTDKGFIGGLIGFDPDDEQFSEALTVAPEHGLDFSFDVEEIPHPHPNAARIHVQGASGKKLTVLTLSTGGGMFELVELNGHAINMSGVFHELVVFGPDDTVLDTLLSLAADSGARMHRERNGQGGFVQFTFDRAIPENFQKEGERLEKEHDCTVLHLPPVLPVGGQFTYDLPFMTAAEATGNFDTAQCSPADLAFDYEMARSGLTREAILARMTDIVRVMQQAAAKGMETNMPTTGYMAPKAAVMANAMPNTAIADLGVMNRGMLIATAIMEYNSAEGVVVAAPTAGSCGVLPAVILAMAESMHISEEEQAKALLTAGLVGVFIAHQATFAAEVCACQAEVGAATAMAAAATVQLLGGNADQAFAAAGLALQNVLGLICDPVAGLVAIPCVNRNSMGAANAIVSANMIMCGFDPVIPLDEVIVSMREVGKLLPSQLRCTTKGGLCTTPTAIQLSESMN